MTRDPFYQQIIARLNGRLDPELFERCVTVLLRSSYPGLVPIRGGGDMGMDGAIADGAGRAYPLVCTVGEDVIGNLRKSLESYLEGQGPRRHVVSATAQALTPARQRNLEAAAEELGFTLVAVHEQADFANRLYRDPRWCVELLALPHDPPPLSALPRTVRPAPVGELIGRADDLAWLRAATGDVLVVGQPGMGKTAILAEMARSDDGLFVVTEDVGKIMAGVREYQPPALLVDDAHLRTDLLTELRRQREETGAAFRIVADCWPGERDAVARALRATATATRRLEPLTRKEIAAVIRARGITGPDSLTRELIRQADGRPGLAVTLCDICLREETTRAVVLGDALAQDVRGTFERLVGTDAVTALACFAVGGGGGMGVEDVAGYLGLSLARVQEVVSGLAAGGVLAEAAPQRLVVRPEALRHALVRDVFFGGASALPVANLLARAPAPEEATRTLIGARARGGRARVPFDMIAPRLNWASDRTCLEFAFLDEYECRWVLATHPDRLRAVAEAALEYVPVEAADRLLAASAEAGGEWATTLLRQWAEGAFPGSGEPVRRRRAVVRAATRWLDAGRDPRPAVVSVCAALSPSYTEWDTDPADHLRVVRRFGLITDEEKVAVQALWPNVRDRLWAVAAGDWQPLQEFHRVWAYPGLAQVHVSQETVAMMTGFAAGVLADLAQLWRDRPGLLHWAWQMADVQGVELAIALPPDFVTLYSFRDRADDWQGRMAREQEAARVMATRWANEAPEAVAARLAAFEAEASVPGFHSWPRWGSFVCAEIAVRATNPGAWADAFGAAGLPGDLVAPFLGRAVTVGESGWEDRVAAALDRPGAEGAAVSLVLGLPAEPPTRLWEAVWTRLPRFAKLVLVAASKQMPEARVTALLQHPDPKVAAEAAMGEWYSEPAGSVRPPIAAAWRDAVVRGADHVPDAAWEMFPGLARDWLAARIARRDRPCHPDHPPESAVFERLTTQERSDLLATMPIDALWRGGIVARLVGDDADLFALLLTDSRLKRVRLAPLRRPPDGAWQALAASALVAGIEPEEVARAAFDEAGWFRGSESDHWRPWLDGFAALTHATDLRLREVGEIGLEQAERRIAAASREERHEAVYGDLS